ncbi:YhhN domain-containing protein [Coprinopsis sp. MPI-PUGE-AT-0042]|nr:YhhN domain-containing protein [Coprinopsis sp. MPI-PUGE-AT-0042]
MEGLLKLLQNTITLPDIAFVTRLNVALALLIASESKSIYLGSAIFKILASLSFFFGGLARALHASAAAFPVGKNVPTNSVWPMLKEFARGEMWREDPYAFCLVIGLGCSVVGDVLLIPSRENYFRFLKGSPTVDPAAEAATTPSKEKKLETTQTQTVVAGEGDTIYFKAGTFFFALAQIAYTVAFLSAPTSKSAPWNWAYFGLAATFGLSSSWLLGIFGGGGLNLVEIPKDTEPLVKLYVFIITGMIGAASATDNGWQKIIGAGMFMISDLFVALDVFEKKKESETSVQAKPTDKRRGRDGWIFRSAGWVLYFWAQMVLAGSI